MEQFERKLLSTSVVGIPTASAETAATSLRPLRSRERKVDGRTTATLLPSARPLFLPFRSFQAIKEDQMEVLRSVSATHVGAASPPRQPTETFSTSGTRSPWKERSFCGSRPTVEIPQNGAAFALWAFIDETLSRIFPTSHPEDDHRPVLTPTKAGLVDPRKVPMSIGGYHDEHQVLEKEVELAERQHAGSRSGGSVAVLPASPFRGTSKTNPPPQDYRTPEGLAVVLDKIRSHQLVSSPPFDPVREIITATEPQMSDDERAREARACVVSDIRRKRLFARKLIPILEQEDRLVTDSRSLYTNSLQNRKRRDVRRRSSHQDDFGCEAPHISLEDSTSPQNSVAAASSVGMEGSPSFWNKTSQGEASSRRQKVSTVSFGDVFLQR